MEDPSPSRGPTWARDEILLALDLYFRRGGLAPEDAEVVDLSHLLSRLPLHPPPRATTFRNPNGVSKKLWNFAGLDPAYSGVGLARSGRGDREAFDRYVNDRETLSKIVASIRAAAEGPGTYIPTEPEDGEDGSEEGKVLFRLHRHRERSASLARKKKSQARANGTFRCEVCGLDPDERYTEGGDAALECHHTKPLSITGSTTTRLADLALVCANCHRVLHGTRPWPTIAQMKKRVASAT